MKLKKDRITRRYKNFSFYIGIGIATFIVFSYLALPESANAAMIDIRDEHGHVTNWGWWMVNILAPFFITFELIKIAIGVLCLPLVIFGFHGGQEFLYAGWSNLTVMWPGLLLWTIGSLSSD